MAWEEILPTPNEGGWIEIDGYPDTPPADTAPNEGGWLKITLDYTGPWVPPPPPQAGWSVGFLKFSRCGHRPDTSAGQENRSTR